MMRFLIIDIENLAAI